MRYGRKIFQMEVPEHDPFGIPSTAVGAVAALQAFLGFVAIVSLTFLLQGLTFPTVMTLFALWYAMIGVWGFTVIALRFPEMCYFYNLWQANRRG
ncbi:MAG: hypothetical protein ACE5IJ_12210 [Thermoplasmata archaeon]